MSEECCGQRREVAVKSEHVFDRLLPRIELGIWKERKEGEVER